MGRPPANVMVVPRLKNHLLDVIQMRWKITGRYWVHLTDRKKVYCIRVSSMSGVILHLAETEFNRLFMLENEQAEAKAKKRRAAVSKPKRKSSGGRGG
jgi:hypothetical protein